jgi:hypothetical protein
MNDEQQEEFSPAELEACRRAAEAALEAAAEKLARKNEQYHGKTNNSTDQE